MIQFRTGLQEPLHCYSFGQVYRNLYIVTVSDRATGAITASVAVKYRLIRYEPEGTYDLVQMCTIRLRVEIRARCLVRYSDGSLGLGLG